jgi:hypothetical protein
MVVFGLLALWQVTVAAREILYAAPALDWSLASAMERNLASLKADDLPEAVGPYRREGFADQRNDVPGLMGAHSRLWTYRSPRATVVVSADYPFMGWHELIYCYRSLGWILKERKVEAGESEGTGPRVVAGMVKPLEQYGLLVFAFDDERSEPLLVSSQDWRAILRDRLASGLMGLLGGPPPGASGIETRPSYQIQVLWSCEAPPTPADEAQVRELFETARAAFRRLNLGIAKVGGPAREEKGLASSKDASL